MRVMAGVIAGVMARIRAIVMTLGRLRDPVRSEGGNEQARRETRAQSDIAVS